MKIKNQTLNPQIKIPRLLNIKSFQILPKTEEEGILQIYFMTPLYGHQNQTNIPQEKKTVNQEPW